MKTLYRIHAIERLFERGIGINELNNAMETGETIEAYPEGDYPGRLVLAGKGRRTLHMVVAEETSSGQRIIITVYRPDISRWVDGFRRRRDDLLDLQAE